MPTKSTSYGENPCWGCTKRHEHCAIGCDLYAEWRKKKEEEYKLRVTYNEIVQIRLASIHKKRKGKRYGRRKDDSGHSSEGNS